MGEMFAIIIVHLLLKRKNMLSLQCFLHWMKRDPNISRNSRYGLPISREYVYV